MRYIHADDRVCLLRDIERREGPYAAAGLTGTVTEVFRQGQTNILHAKVRADHDGRLYTFRLTSLKRVN